MVIFSKSLFVFGNECTKQNMKKAKSRQQKLSLNKKKIVKQSLLEKVIFLPGVSRCLFQYLPFQTWMLCRSLSRIFAKGIAIQLESFCMPMAFFVRNTTISFPKAVHISLYNEAYTRSCCWIIPGQLYPALQTLAITWKTQDDIDSTSKKGHLILPESIRLKKLSLLRCSKFVSNISFDPTELEEIHLHGELSDGLEISVFATLCKAPKLRMIDLEGVKCSHGSLEAIMRTRSTTSPCQIEMKETPFYRNDFRKCNLSHFTLVQNKKEWEKLKGRAKQLSLSRNPELSVVHIQDPHIEYFQLFTAKECFEQLTNLHLVCNTKMAASLLSSFQTSQNWMNNHLPNVQSMKLIAAPDHRWPLLDRQLSLQNHKHLYNLEVSFVVSSIHVQDMKGLHVLKISNIENVSIQSNPLLQYLNLHTSRLCASVHVDQVYSLTQFVWVNQKYCNVFISSLQIPWEQVQTIEVPAFVSNMDISNSLSLQWHEKMLKPCICLRKLQLTGNINKYNTPNDLLSPKLISTCSQLPTLQDFKLRFFEGIHLSFISGFGTLQQLEIEQPKMEEGICISNLPSLEVCIIKYIRNPLPRKLTHYI